MSWVIELDNVHQLYGQTCVLDVERLNIEAAECVFVVGRSGSGKTTLERLIKGGLRPSAGNVTVLDCNPNSPVPSERRTVQRRIAMIDQEFFLVPRLGVIANVLTGCLGRVSPWKSLLGWYPAHEWEKAEAILREVELDSLANRRVETLSGGQRQRAAIARALMQDAEIILADEPISNLDPELAEDALGLLVDCVKRRRVTLVVNLHQPSLARQFATRIIGLSEGKVVYDGAPEGFTVDEAELVYRGQAKPNHASEGVKHDEPAKAVGEKTPRSNLRLLRR